MKPTNRSIARVMRRRGPIRRRSSLVQPVVGRRPASPALVVRISRLLRPWLTAYMAKVGEIFGNGYARAISAAAVCCSRLVPTARSGVRRIVHSQKSFVDWMTRWGGRAAASASRLRATLTPRLLVAATGVFIFGIMIVAGLRIESPPEGAQEESPTVLQLHEPVEPSPATRDSRHQKALVTWARKAPLRRLPKVGSEIAGAEPDAPTDHVHFDDLPMPPEENLASVQPNLTLPDVPPRSEDVPQSEDAMLLPAFPPEKPRQSLPQWLANAVEPELTARGPLIAVVIDDVGINQQGTARAVDLPAPLTLAFIPYGYDLERHTQRARKRGHELLVHMPMEPSSTVADPGPNALLTSLQEDEIMRRFKWGLSQFDGYVGVSNHMGSQFMSRGDLVKPLLDEIEQRGLLFLDSWTRADTAGTELARNMGIPNTRRDVFLDNEQTEEEVTKRLGQLETVARRKGYAVGLGHPHQVTLDVLAKWIPEARARGITLVPISTIVRLDYGEGYERMLAAAAGGRETDRLLSGTE